MINPSENVPNEASAIDSELACHFTFDDANQAVRILRPDAPQPWINYLSNGTFHAFVSQAGGGFAWWKSPTLLRLTRYRQYNLPLDSPGFYVYIRHADGTTWSPTWRPCETPLDRWEATHQPGRTTFVAEKNGIAATLRLFVAPEFDALLWRLQLENRGSTPEGLDVFAYTELSQLNWSGESPWGYYCKLQLRTWFDQPSDAVNYLFHGDSPRNEIVPLVFLASDRPVASYSGSRNDFVGDYRSERNPVDVERGICGNTTISCGEPAAVLHSRLMLTEGQAEEVQYVLGIAPGALTDLADAEVERDRILTTLRQPGAFDRQEELVASWWRQHLEVLQCSVPAEDVQRQINIWSPVNSVHTGRYSRAVNTAAPGIRGVGFRDTCQDMLAIAYRRPAWAQQTFLFLLTQQYRAGHTVHYTYPEEKQTPTVGIRSDNHLWLPLVAWAILGETGDLSLLEQPAAYLAEDHTSADGEGSVWEHLLAAMRFTENNLGAHRIPLTFHSDWNDIIGRFNKSGRGETVFAGMQYVLCLRRLIEIARLAGRPEIPWLRGCLKRQEEALLACAWDGVWWRRGFDDNGQPVGSALNECGQIFLNPQSWAVLSSLGSTEQQQSGMNAAHTQLDTGLGLKILSPSFQSWDSEGREQIGYGAGCGENGAIFCHANTWAIIAEAILGRGDRAWSYFRQLIPANAMQKAGIHRYRAEPYAWVSNIVGPDNERFGWANVEQITGTAPWMDVAATQYLLGVRPTPAGLVIDPCLPPEWRECRVQRLFRGCDLDIRVLNPDGQMKGVRRMTAAGRGLSVQGRGMLTQELLSASSSLHVVVEL